MVTLEQVHSVGHGLYANCGECMKTSKLDLPALIALYGPEAVPGDLPFKCSRCGCRRVSFTVVPLAESVKYHPFGRESC